MVGQRMAAVNPDAVSGTAGLLLERGFDEVELASRPRHPWA